MKDGIVELFNKDELDQKVNEILDGWNPNDLSEKDFVKGWFEIQYQALFYNLEDITDDEDIKVTLKYRYLELKSHWFQLNNRVQYAMINGKINETLTYKTSLISLLINQFEEILSNDIVENIHLMLNDFLESNIDENHLNMEKQLIDLYRDKELLNKYLGISNPLKIIKTIDDLKEKNKTLQEKLKDLDEESIEIRFEDEKMVIYGPQKIFVNKNNKKT